MRERIKGLLWAAAIAAALALLTKLATGATPYAAPVQSQAYYRVGAAVRGEALATQAFRQSADFQELQLLRAFYAGVMSAGGGGGDASVGAEDGAGAKPQAAERPAGDFASRRPTIAAQCMKCHQGEDPSGGVWLDGTDEFDADDQAAIAAAVVNGRMPKGRVLDADTEYQLLVELFTEASEDAP